MTTIAPEIIEKILSPEFNRRMVDQDFLVAYEQRLAAAGFATAFVEQEMRRLSNWFDLDAVASYTHRAYRQHYDRCLLDESQPCPPPDFAYIDALPAEICPDGTPSHTKSMLVMLANAYQAVLTAYQSETGISGTLNNELAEVKEALRIAREDKKDLKAEKDELLVEVRQRRQAEKQALTADSLLEAAQLWLNAHPREGDTARSLMAALLKGQRQEEVAALRYRSALTDENDRLAALHGKAEALAAARRRLHPLVANPEQAEEFLGGVLKAENNEELKQLAIKPMAKLAILGTDKIQQKELVNLVLTLLHYTEGASYPRIETLFSQRNK